MDAAIGKIDSHITFAHGHRHGIGHRVVFVPAHNIPGRNSANHTAYGGGLVVFRAFRALPLGPSTALLCYAYGMST